MLRARKLTTGQQASDMVGHWLRRVENESFRGKRANDS